MKGAHEIYMDFRRAKEEVAELRRIGKSIETLANQEMQPTLRSVERNWNGESADAFIDKGFLVEERVLQTAYDIYRIAETIEKIAQNTYNNEMRNLEIARKKH